MSLKQKEIKLKPRIKLKPPATYTFDVLVFQKCNITSYCSQGRKRLPSKIL